MVDNGEDAVRPWDDPSDPKPDPFFVDGRWTREGVDWCLRSGRRRLAYTVFHHLSHPGRKGA